MLPVYDNEDPASNAVAKKLGRQLGRKLRRNLLDFKMFSSREGSSLARVLLIVGIILLITVVGVIVLRQRAITGFADSAKLSSADKQSGRLSKPVEEKHFPEEVPETKQEDVKREQVEELEPVRDKDGNRDGDDAFARPGAPVEGVAKIDNENEADENTEEAEAEQGKPTDEAERQTVMQKLPNQKVFLKQTEESTTDEESAEQTDQQENVEMELKSKKEEMPLKNSEEQEELEHAAENVEDLNTRRRNAVKEAFLHAWNGYKQHAFGHDEIRPTTNQTNDSWGGFGATLVDALDTMLVMNIDRPLIDEAIAFVAGLDFNKDKKVSFFETTIRYVGGLLACYELSKHPICLQKAKELTDRLMPAFDKTLGIPYHEVNLQTGKAGNPSWTGGASILSEVGSVQLEFKYLSHHTKDPKYANAADKIFDLLNSKKKTYKGLYPLMIDVKSGDFVSDQVTFGALADSFYEYLLKRYLLGNKKDSKFRAMYDESIDGLKQYLLDKSKPSGLLFISELNHGKQVHRFEHLTCFVPGMLTLGAMDENVPESRRNEDIAIATEVLKTCMHLYFNSATGIAPDIVTYQSESDKGSQHGDHDYTPERSTYLLRPETVESIFYMYRYTKDEKYRDLGWKIFESINKHCRTKSSFSGLTDVNELPPKHNNSQQSFFFAETLKYFYLLFSPDDVIPLDKYVFTTEGHPLGVLPE